MTSILAWRRLRDLAAELRQILLEPDAGEPDSQAATERGQAGALLLDGIAEDLADLLLSAVASAMDTTKLLTVLPSKAASSIHLLAAGFNPRLRRSLFVEAVSVRVIASLGAERCTSFRCLMKITGPSSAELRPPRRPLWNRLDSHSRP